MFVPDHSEREREEKKRMDKTECPGHQCQKIGRRLRRKLAADNDGRLFAQGVLAAAVVVVAVVVAVVFLG